MSQTRHYPDVALVGPAPRQMSPIGAVQQLLAAAADRVLAWQERTRQRIALAALTDGELRDLGLSRADVAHETSKPFWRL